MQPAKGKDQPISLSSDLELVVMVKPNELVMDLAKFKLATFTEFSS